MKNMLKQLATLIVIVIYSLLATNITCAKENTKKQEIYKEARELSDFKNIIVTGNGKLFIKYGKKNALKIEGAEDVLSKFKSEVKEDSLYLGPKEDVSNIDTSINYYLTLKQLEKIEASGNVEITSRENINADQFSISLAGSSKATLKLKLKNLNTQMSGNSFVNLQGNTDEQAITMLGTGEFSGKKLSSQITHVNISGNGLVEVNVNKELDVKIQGTGKVKYYGRPKIIQEISGNGEIIPLG